MIILWSTFYFSDCEPVADLKAISHCNNDILTVRWPTSLTYNGTVTDIPASLLQRWARGLSGRAGNPYSVWLSSIKHLRMLLNMMPIWYCFFGKILYKINCKVIMLDVQAIIEPKLSIELSFKNKLGSNVFDYACTANVCDS